MSDDLACRLRDLLEHGGSDAIWKAAAHDCLDALSPPPQSDVAPLVSRLKAMTMLPFEELEEPPKKTWLKAADALTRQHAEIARLTRAVEWAEASRDEARKMTDEARAKALEEAAQVARDTVPRHTECGLKIERRILALIPGGAP